MPTDILIGAADQYQWKDVKPWMQTARRCGFTGDIYLICYRVSDELKVQAEMYGVNLYEVEHTPYGQPIVHVGSNTPTQSHNMRFYHAWELLTRLDPTNYRYCIMTDVRDVIFQDNPSTALENMEIGEGRIVASSEGIYYGREEWNMNNLLQGFGQTFSDVAEANRWTVYNVGVLAGDAEYMAKLCQIIYAMAEGRYYPADQSSYNVLLRSLLAPMMVSMSMHLPWAAQMGTTNDPTKAWLWDRLHEPRPVIRDGKVYTQGENGKLFCIVHQYDRVPELKDRYV